ncbi:hypothetical protein GPJ56_003188 [Histomonas meleagridis]|uniref:uncharacterized protein n=1 Tax=Histomonas meleagridis TaxID=135588 RepID=UPI00355A6D4C|nr:hypothetical protein GPJ56_003188 [Histomonas meleagridis]KAH0801221.1 hypothetical protein GO595_005816 [Histomonas meleagridis]
MSNPFAILSDYNGADEVPQREKVIRKKNKHEPGSGYRSTIKREGRGRSNWGNAIDEAKRPELTEQQETEQQGTAENAEPKIVYESAFKYFASDDEDETPRIKREGKRVVKIPEQYASMVVEKKTKTTEVKTYNEVSEPEVIETGFLSTAEALRQRQNARRGGYNNNRNGGRRPNPQRKPQGDRPQRPAPQRNAAPKPATTPAQGENTQQERKPRSKPRDQRPGNVQHQRQVGSGKKQSNLSLNNFPKLQ